MSAPDCNASFSDMGGRVRGCGTASVHRRTRSCSTWNKRPVPAHTQRRNHGRVTAAFCGTRTRHKAALMSHALMSPIKCSTLILSATGLLSWRASSVPSRNIGNCAMPRSACALCERYYSAYAARARRCSCSSSPTLAGCLPWLRYGLFCIALVEVIF